MTNDDLVNDLQRNAAMARDFVRQLDAPILHRRFNKMAELLDRAAARIKQLEGTNKVLRK